MEGKKYRIDDSEATGHGSIYLKYTIGGKTIETSLKTNSVTEAKKKRAEIMRPLELASDAEVLEQTALRLKRVQSEQEKDWEKRNPPLTNAWTDYLKAQNRPHSGKQTLAGYASQYKKFREWIQSAFPETVCMKDVGVREAEAYAEHLNSRNLSPSTYNQNLNTLALVWSVLFEKAHA